ncbi:MAG: zinc-ribbon domain-containing protein [Polyangiaceae bacterium]
MPARERRSMLTREELAHFAGVSVTRVADLLRRAKPKWRRFPSGHRVVVWQELERGLAPAVADRMLRRARADGIDLRELEATIAGHPRLLAEWHWKRNGQLVPWAVPKATVRRMWWKCPAGPDHEWQQSVAARQSKKGCPFCVGQRVSVTNSLATRTPALARQWHPTKNGKLTPSGVQWRSSRRVWWQCRAKARHEWQDRIGARNAPTRRPLCPFCSSRRLADDNCLARRAPAIARQWHPTKNGKLTPRDVVPGSSRIVWWKCTRGRDHEWRQSPNARTHGRGCPFCAGKKTSVTNSLAKRFPVLARDWHPTKNGKLTPHDIVPGSAKLVWWRCSKDAGHVWRASPFSRTHSSSASKLAACPFCRGRRVAPSNCLATVAPDVATEWHPTKNGKLTPKDVTSGLIRKVWWRCELGHSWRAPIRNRARRGSGCPKCDLLRRRGQLRDRA